MNKYTEVELAAIRRTIRFWGEGTPRVATVPRGEVPFMILGMQIQQMRRNRTPCETVELYIRYPPCLFYTSMDGEELLRVYEFDRERHVARAARIVRDVLDFVDVDVDELRMVRQWTPAQQKHIETFNNNTRDLFLDRRGYRLGAHMELAERKNA